MNKIRVNGMTTRMVLVVTLAVLALAGCGGGRDEQSASRCVPTDLLMAPGTPIEQTMMVESSRHPRLWFVAARMQDSRTGVWAIDDPAAPSWLATVDDVARELTPQLPDISEHTPDPPDYWVTSRGEHRAGSWRSDMVGITVFTDGAREAWDCVHRDGLY